MHQALAASVASCAALHSGSSRACGVLFDYSSSTHTNMAHRNSTAWVMYAANLHDTQQPVCKTRTQTYIFSRHAQQMLLSVEAAAATLQQQLCRPQSKQQPHCTNHHHLNISSHRELINPNQSSSSLSSQFNRQTTTPPQQRS